MSVCSLDLWLSYTTTCNWQTVRSPVVLEYKPLELSCDRNSFLYIVCISTAPRHSVQDIIDELVYFCLLLQEGVGNQQQAILQEMLDRDALCKEETKRRQAILHDLNRDVIAMVSQLLVSLHVLASLILLSVDVQARVCFVCWFKKGQTISRKLQGWSKMFAIIRTNINVHMYVYIIIRVL